MGTKCTNDRVKTLLKDTVTLLCRNGLEFKNNFTIEALIGVTLDDDNVFMVSINEQVKLDKVGETSDSDHREGSTAESRSQGRRKRSRKKKLLASAEAGDHGDYSNDSDDGVDGQEQGVYPVKRFKSSRGNISVDIDNDNSQNFDDTVIIKCETETNDVSESAEVEPSSGDQWQYFGSGPGHSDFQGSSNDPAYYPGGTGLKAEPSSSSQTLNNKSSSSMTSSNLDSSMPFPLSSEKPHYPAATSSVGRSIWSSQTGTSASMGTGYQYGNTKTPTFNQSQQNQGLFRRVIHSDEVFIGRPRRIYSDDDMNNAVNAVLYGGKSLRNAAKMYNIPTTSLFMKTKEMKRTGTMQ